MQKTYVLTVTSLLLVVGAVSAVQGQGLVGGFMAGKGHGSVVVSGTTERYESVYLAPAKIDHVPAYESVRVNSLNLYATYGITDKIDAVVSLPYIQSKSSADEAVISSLAAQQPTKGFASSRQDFQDITGLLKFKAYTRETNVGIIDLLGVVSVSTPVSNYETNQGLGYIIAIGNRATKYTAVGIAHLKTGSGIFATGQLGYSLRTGQVPNALIGEAKIGYAGPKTYLEGYATFQESNSGTDITENGFDKSFFPSTRVNYVRLGASIFRPLAKGIGVVLGANTYVAGRNIGKSTGYSLGVTYNF